jgi:hypothetical protein
MKFHKLHNQKVLFWMTKYIIMFMTCKKCEIKFKLCILCLLKIVGLKIMSHAVNKKAFSNGSKSVEDEKKC